MKKINILDRSVYELIAAGEVIERPASVVKELIENSVDAGARNITVEIRNGGIKYLRVTDDGCGIAYDDVPAAFVRHATSKVKNAADLDSISTLGFRGEALASVAAVAKVEMLTKPRDTDKNGNTYKNITAYENGTGGAVENDLADKLISNMMSKRSGTTASGTRYAITGGDAIEIETAECAYGTTIIIQDIFFNTPARHKFLKKDTTEANYIASVVEKAALANPSISFKLLRDGKTALLTAGDNRVISAARAVLGSETADGLIPVSYTDGKFSLNGYISSPNRVRSSRAGQNFFVNSRYIRSKVCTAALEEGYRGSIMVGKFPAAVVNIVMPVTDIDVNVHPAKVEVRFSDDRAIFSLINNAVKTAILAADNRKNILSERAGGGISGSGGGITGIGNTVAMPRVNTLRGKTWGDDATDGMPALRTEAADKSRFAFMKDKLRVADEPPKFSALYLKIQEEKGNSCPQGKSCPQGNSHLQDNSHPQGNSCPQGNSHLQGNSCPQGKSSPRFDSGDVVKENASFFANTNLPQLPVSTNLPQSPVNANLPQSLANTPPQYPANSDTADCVTENSDTLRFIGELFKTYILCEKGGEFLLIDKHAADERLRFNRLKRQLQTHSQLLAEVLAVPLPPELYAEIANFTDVLADIGIEVMLAAETCTVEILSLPAEIYNRAAGADILTEIAVILQRGGGRDEITAELYDDMLHIVACRAAIKAGDTAADGDLYELALAVLADNEVSFCPHGRPVVMRYSKYEIEKYFGRV